MSCPEEITEKMTCTGLDAGLPLVVNGIVWVPPEVVPELEDGE